jgi:ankyrin repeat protein
MTQPHPEDLDMMYSALKSDNLDTLCEALQSYDTVDLIMFPPERSSPRALLQRPSILQTAAYYGAETCFRHLISFSPEFEHQDQYGVFFDIFRKLAHFAAFSGHLRIFQLLDELSVELNPTGVNYVTPFHIAAKHGHLSLCKWLYIHSAEIEQRTADGYAPIHLAAKQHHFDVVDFLISLGVNVNDFFNTGKTLFVEALTNVGKELPLAEYLIARNTDQVADTHGTFPIHAASQHRHLGIIRELIEHGADVNERDRKGLSPLHFAVKKNSVDVCVLLLESGAELEASDQRKRTALHYAAASGYLEVVELLCDFGADACAVDGENMTPAGLAYRHGRNNVAQYFAALGLAEEDWDEEEELPSRHSRKRWSIRGEFPGRKVNWR